MALVYGLKRICLKCSTEIGHGNKCPSCGNDTFDIGYTLFRKITPKKMNHPIRNTSDQMRIHFE